MQVADGFWHCFANNCWRLKVLMYPTQQTQRLRASSQNGQAQPGMYRKSDTVQVAFNLAEQAY